MYSTLLINHAALYSLASNPNLGKDFWYGTDSPTRNSAQPRDWRQLSHHHSHDSAVFLVQNGNIWNANSSVLPPNNLRESNFTYFTFLGLSHDQMAFKNIQEMNNLGREIWCGILEGQERVCGSLIHIGPTIRSDAQAVIVDENGHFWSLGHEEMPPQANILHRRNKHKITRELLEIELALKQRVRIDLASPRINKVVSVLACST